MSAKERPIIMSAPMVRAILDGRKTQTRRVIKPQPELPEPDCHRDHTPKHPAPYWDAYCSERPTPSNPRGMSDQWCAWQVDDRQCLPCFRCPYGAPGDRLWMRETYCPVDDREFGGEQWIDYRATPRYEAEHPAGWENDPSDPAALKWRSSMFMPRSASRITLEITDVRVQRVCEITEADARAEGHPITWDGKGYDPPPPEVDSWQGYGRYSFSLHWITLNAKRGFGWAENPWVWCISFRRVDA